MARERVDGELYQAVGCTLLAMGRAHVLAHSAPGSPWELLDSGSAQLLSHCRPFRPLEEHAGEICRRLGLGPERVVGVTAQLSDLARAGFLVSRASILQSASGVSAAPPPVSTFAMVTKGRPKLLERSLSTFLQNQKHFGRTVRCVVADDSTSPREREEVIGVLGSLARRFGRELSVAGVPEKEAFAAALAEQGGFDPQVLSFGLGLRSAPCPAPGSNRNSLLLDTVGELWVGVDDDIFCAPCSAAQPAPNADLRLSSEIDPTEFWFHPDRASLERTIRPAPADYLAVHEELLGRALSGPALAIPGRRIILDAAGDRLLLSLRNGGGRVRVTMTGIHGDSGMGSPAWLLWLSGASRERLTRSESDYRSACSSREIIRQVSVATVSDGPCFMTGSAGYDHREPVPPFMPSYRSEDDVFRAMLRRCYPEDGVGHAPYTVLHDPPEPRSYAPDAIWDTACSVRQRNIVRICIDDAPIHVPTDVPGRLRSLGNHLRDLGSLPAPEFAEFLRSRLAEQAAEWVTRSDERVREWRGAPAYWSRDFLRALDHVRRSIGKPGWEIPGDRLDPSGSPDLGESRTFVRRLGDLIRIWPDVLAESKRLRSAGRRLARPV